MHPAIKVIGGIVVVGAAAVAGALFGVAAASYEITRKLSYEELACLVKDEVVGPIIEGALGVQAAYETRDDRKANPRMDTNDIARYWFRERFGLDMEDDAAMGRAERRSKHLHRGKFGRYPWGE